MPIATLPARSNRLVFLDALRGIACLLVFGFHLIHLGALQPVLARHLPTFFIEFTRYGLYGVQIFFVLSGFVIAHSLRATPINARSVGRFIVRRQLRLDPPYWAMLALCPLLWWIEMQLFGPPRFSHPS